MTLAEETERLEKVRILEAILDTGGITQASRVLRISRITIYKRLRKWNLAGANARELILYIQSVNKENTV